MELLGIKIEENKKKDIFNFVKRALGGKEKRIIITLNPEIILKADRDNDYKKIIKEADLRIVDGFGLKLIAWLKRAKTGERLAGADLAKYILKKAKEKNLKIGLVLRRGGWSSKNDLEKEIKGKTVLIVEQKDNNLKIADILLDREVLLVGLGAPDQEKFIWENREQLPNLKLAIGVGGTFDYWTGKKKRAPGWMRRIGMEWFWRLLIQPNRIFRIWNATVVFLWKGLFKK